MIEGELLTWEEQFGELIEQVDAFLDKTLPSEETYPQSLHRAMRYSVLGRGKRLRPILVMAAARTCGTDPALVLPTAAGIECIHAYSLIHDDLPVMDNSDERRGKPSCHLVFGEAIALLAGDALQALAFELIASNGFDLGLRPQEVLRVVKEVAQACGSQGLVGGQVGDIESQGCQPNQEMINYICSRKTGALIQASVKAGAILARAGEDRIAVLSQYASHLGIAFQIVDDILDLVGNPEKMGKRVGQDEAKHKATYPAAFGLEEAKRKVSKEVAAAISLLQIFGRKADLLRRIADFLLHRDH
ncbi:MAG: polyprenyl synthetase family protein [Clostridia bacterium]|nr:polyprenyl synthetase family protein [Clostridia bacterium]